MVLLVNQMLLYYNNTTNTDSIKKFGVLYNWFTVETKKNAPAGWHVPDTTDWKVLQEYLISKGYNYDGTVTDNKIAKAMASKTDWLGSSNNGAPGYDSVTNNSSGFSSLPSGHRLVTGYFEFMGIESCFWCTMTMDGSNVNYAYDYSLMNNRRFSELTYNYKECGFSVRLIKD